MVSGNVLTMREVDPARLADRVARAAEGRGLPRLGPGSALYPGQIRTTSIPALASPKRLAGGRPSAARGRFALFLG